MESILNWTQTFSLLYILSMRKIQATQGRYGLLQLFMKVYLFQDINKALDLLDLIPSGFSPRLHFKG